MKIAVLIKQVPAVDTVKINEATGTMERDGVEAELNPLDLHALEAAIRLKEEGHGSVTAVTMGPLQAKRTLRAAIAMGCDDASLLCDRRFAGADTLATAYALAAYIRRSGGFDIILSGERATDGETGQVPPAVAEFLGIPVLTYVSSLDSLVADKLIVTRSVEGGREKICAPLPALLSVTKEINKPRMTTLRGKLRAKNVEIAEYDAASLGLEEERIGLKGSPTRVVKVMYPKVTRSGRRYIVAQDSEGALAALCSCFEEGGFLDPQEVRA